MTSFFTLKKILGLLLFLLLFFLSIALPARAATTLTGIQKQEDPSRTRLTFTLSAAAGFRVDHSGQRIELTFREAAPAETLRALPEDGTIVSTTLIRRQQDLIISLLLRRPPHLVTTESQSDPARVIVNIDWHGDDGARPAIAFRIADMPPRRAGAEAARFAQQSPWDGHWRTFFRDYRGAWSIDLPQELTPPPPLQLVTDTRSPLWPLQQHSDAKLFLSVLKSAAELHAVSAEDRYLRDLFAAEAFLRSGSHAAGLMRLEQLRAQNGGHQTRVEYLTAWGESARQNPIAGLLQLQTRLTDLPVTDPLAAAVTLLHAEAALATAQYQLALDQLTATEIPWPESLTPARLIRQADAMAGLGQRDAALENYRRLAAQSALCDFYHSSCNRAAAAAFQTGDYDFARQLYRRLALEFSNQPGADLIHFAAGAAAYEAGDFDWGWIGLEQVQLDYPATQGGDRARLRLIDIRIINGGHQELVEAVAQYAQLGQRSSDRLIREESFFKEALALFLLENHHDSVTRLMRFKRDFRSSTLRREADLLLNRQLPLVVDRLLAEKQELQAVVLVEQNRELLLAGGYDRAFLHNLATAFDHLGLYDRAARVLLYLFDHSAGTPAQQDLYLPLAKSFQRRDQYLQASDYARRYLTLYPLGADAGALFDILLDAYEKSRQDDELHAWLLRPERPHSAAVDIRAARFYWQRGDFNAVVSNLRRAAAHAPLGGKELALLAEACFRLDDLSAAQEHYRPLLDDAEFGSQARYRYAQILLRQGDHPAAVKQLEQLVGQDAGSSWGKLARDLLIQHTRRNS